MTAYRIQIRNAAAAALQQAAALYAASPALYPDFAPLVGVVVVLSRTWPTQSPAPGKPAPPATILCYTFRDHKETRAPAGTSPHFKTTLTLVLEPRIENPQASGASAVDAQLDALCLAIEGAILQQANLLTLVEIVSAVETQLKYDDRGQRVLGNAVMAFDLVYDEVYEPIETTLFNGANLYIDALNVFDPTGQYTPPFPYPVQPGSPTSPRIKGPDGRPEIAEQVSVVMLDFSDAENSGYIAILP
jgi:hypothetical protein